MRVNRDEQMSSQDGSFSLPKKVSQTPSQIPRNLTDQRGALLSSVVVDRGRDRGHAVYPSPHAGGGMDVGKL